MFRGLIIIFTLCLLSVSNAIRSSSWTLLIKGTAPVIFLGNWQTSEMQSNRLYSVTTKPFIQGIDLKTYNTVTYNLTTSTIISQNTIIRAFLSQSGRFYLVSSDSSKGILMEASLYEMDGSFTFTPAYILTYPNIKDAFHLDFIGSSTILLSVKFTEKNLLNGLALYNFVSYTGRALPKLATATSSSPSSFATFLQISKQTGIFGDVIIVILYQGVLQFVNFDTLIPINQLIKNAADVSFFKLIPSFDQNRLIFNVQLILYLVIYPIQASSLPIELSAVPSSGQINQILLASDSSFNDILIISTTLNDIWQYNIGTNTWTNLRLHNTFESSATKIQTMIFNYQKQPDDASSVLYGKPCLIVSFNTGEVSLIYLDGNSDWIPLAISFDFPKLNTIITHLLITPNRLVTNPNIFENYLCAGTNFGDIYFMNFFTTKSEEFNFMESDPNLANGRIIQRVFSRLARMGNYFFDPPSVIDGINSSGICEQMFYLATFYRPSTSKDIFLHCSLLKPQTLTDVTYLFQQLDLKILTFSDPFFLTWRQIKSYIFNNNVFFIEFNQFNDSTDSINHDAVNTVFYIVYGISRSSNIDRHDEDLLIMQNIVTGGEEKVRFTSLKYFHRDEGYYLSPKNFYVIIY